MKRKYVLITITSCIKFQCFLLIYQSVLGLSRIYSNLGLVYRLLKFSKYKCGKEHF